jgi:hypothetical protein
MARWGFVLIIGLTASLSWAVWGVCDGAEAHPHDEDVYTLGGGFWSGPPSGRAIGAEGADEPDQDRGRDPLPVRPVSGNERRRFRCIHAE